jgi:hypothetical protein
VIAPARRRAFRLTLFLTFMVVLSLASARQLVISPSHGQDFRDFFAAATLVARGGDPRWRARRGQLPGSMRCSTRSRRNK